MTRPAKITTRFQWVRNTSVIILCLYYYLSLFRQANSISGLDVAQGARVLLTLFFVIVAVQLILNVHVVYAAFQRSRTSFLTILLCVSIFTLITRQSWLIIPFLLFLSFSDNSLRVLAKKLFISSAICFAAVISLGLFLPDLGRGVVDKSYSVASLIGTNANSLGFPNSNQPLLYFLVLVINGAFLFETKKERRLYALIMFVVASIIFAATLSVTGYICVAIFLGFYSMPADRYLKVARVIIPMIIALALISTPLVATRYGQDNKGYSNKVLANRPYLWNLRVSDGAYSNVIGNTDRFQSKSVEDESGYTLDNQYLLLIARYGWLSLLITLYVYFGGVRRVTNMATMAGLLSLSVYFVFESVMFILVLCIIPVVMIDTKNAKMSTEIGRQI